VRGFGVLSAGSAAPAPGASRPAVRVPGGGGGPFPSSTAAMAPAWAARTADPDPQRLAAAGDEPLPPLAGDEPPPLLTGRRQRLCPRDMDPGVQRPPVSSSPSPFSIYYISAVHDLLLLDFFGPHFLFLCPFSIYSVFAFLNFFLIFFVCSGWRLASPNMSRWRLLFPFSIYSIYSAA